MGTTYGHGNFTTGHCALTWWVLGSGNQYHDAWAQHMVVGILPLVTEHSRGGC